MSYSPPTGVYYVFINFKIGNFDASPLPPQHVNSLSIEMGSTDTFAKGQLVVYDDTAIQIEDVLAGGADRCELEFGYTGANQPRIKYKLKVVNYSLQFKNDGSSELTLSLTSGAVDSIAAPKTKSYIGMSIEQIVQDIAKEEGWTVKADSIEPIKPMMEDDPNVASANGANNVTAKRYKTYIRSNMSAPQFIQTVLAPECVSARNGQAGYRLFFSEAGGIDVSEIDPSYTSGGGGGSFADVTSSILGSISRAAGWFGSFFGIGSEVNALQEMDGKSVLTEKTNNVDPIEAAFAAVDAVQKVSEGAKIFTTPQTDSVMYFRPMANYTDMLNTEQLKKQESSRTNVRGDARAQFNQMTQHIEELYRFEIGTNKNFTVISFTPEVNGTAILTGGGGSVQGAAMNRRQNTLTTGERSLRSNPNQPTTGPLTVGSNGVFIIQGSSLTTEELDRMAANLFAKAQNASVKANLEILGDPRIQIQKMCSVLYLTKFGQVHHTSGIWQITSVTHNIQGGTYTTSMELTRNGGTKGNTETNGTEIAGGGKARGSTAVSQDAKDYQRQENGDIQAAINEAIAVANDDTHAYATKANERNGPNYDNSSFIYHCFETAGFGVGEKASGGVKAGTCESMEGDFRQAGFDVIDYDPKNLQPGDIIWSPDHAEIYLGNSLSAEEKNLPENKDYLGEKVGARYAKDIPPADQISVSTMTTETGKWTKVFRYTKKVKVSDFEPKTEFSAGGYTINTDGIND